MTGCFSSEKQSPATFTHGRRSDKDVKLVDIERRKKKECSSSQRLSHKVQLFSAERQGHKDTSILLAVVPEQGWQHSAGQAHSPPRLDSMATKAFSPCSPWSLQIPPCALSGNSGVHCRLWETPLTAEQMKGITARTFSKHFSIRTLLLGSLIFR